MVGVIQNAYCNFQDTSKAKHDKNSCCWSNQANLPLPNLQLHLVIKQFNFGNRTLAAQDFWHATQASGETVSSYILHLEKIFRQAYGQDKMRVETRSVLLYSQLQDGLRYALMKAPSVSGAWDYQELCIAARNEEHRLNDLAKQY